MNMALLTLVKMPKHPVGFMVVLHLNLKRQSVKKSGLFKESGLVKPLLMIKQTQKTMILLSVIISEERWQIV